MLKAFQTDNDGRVETTKRGRTLPIKDTIEKVRGYNTLTIYRMEASPYWYVRYSRATGSRGWSNMLRS